MTQNMNTVFNCFVSSTYDTFNFVGDESRIMTWMMCWELLTEVSQHEVNYTFWTSFIQFHQDNCGYQRFDNNSWSGPTFHHWQSALVAFFLIYSIFRGQVDLQVWCSRVFKTLQFVLLLMDNHVILSLGQPSSTWGIELNCVESYWRTCALSIIIGLQFPLFLQQCKNS